MKSFVAVAALLLVSAFAVAAAWFAYQVYMLLIERTDSPMASRDAHQGYWEDERRRALHNLKEVHFDFDTGKIDQADYQALRVRYEERAVRAMDELAQHGDDADNPSTESAS
ncbi:MAG: hypothetical protein CMH53_06055 [Myxococcales bacterium]|nr:hypothetical protein [Myxococcales bacterium]